jgi:hypothetical protein
MSFATNLQSISKNLTQDYKGEWKSGQIYKLNDVVRVNGRAYICKTNYYNENNTYGDKVKPEIDPSGWETYSSGYMWTGQWKEFGEYYPGDIVNYNADQYVCITYGKMTHPVYDRGGVLTTKWQKISSSSNKNKKNRIVGFGNRNPFGWGSENYGWHPGELDNGTLESQGIGFINGDYEFISIGRVNSGNYGLGDRGYTFNDNPNTTNVGSMQVPGSPGFEFFDFYDNFRTSSGSRPNIIQLIQDGSQISGVLFDNGEVYFSGTSAQGQLGDGGTGSKFYMKRVGRSNNTTSNISGSTEGSRGQGLLRDVKVIKIAQTSNTYTNNTPSCGALDDLGRIWTWGQNDTYALGRNFNITTATDSSRPGFIRPSAFGNRKIIDFWLAGGNYRYGMAKDQNGDLWGWGHNTIGQLGVGEDLNIWEPKRVPYDWQKHGGIKKLSTSGYNLNYTTIVLTNDGVLHMSGQTQYGPGSNFYARGDDENAVGRNYAQFSPMQKIWWDKANSIGGLSGTELRSFWNITDLYNDVEDFWYSKDLLNSKLFIKQKSTGLIYAVGISRNFSFSTLAQLADLSQDLGNAFYSEVSLSYPIPMNLGISDCIDVARIGFGDQATASQGFLGAAWLNSDGRVVVNGAAANGFPEDARGLGVSPRSGSQMEGGRNKLPWEFNPTSSYAPRQVRWNQKVAAIKSYGSGWFAICQDDRLYYTGTQTWSAGFEQGRLQNNSSTHSSNLCRLLT